MARYSAVMNDTLVAATSIGVLTASATVPRRTLVDFFSMGMEATPADGAYLVELNRVTTAGTSSAVTPKLLDMANVVAATDVVGENATVEPATTAGEVMLAIAQHQRSSCLWYAPPGGEIVLPATASAGLIWKTITVNNAVGAITVCAHFTE